MKKIRVAIVGVGNCCSALYQGLSYYENSLDYTGIVYPSIGGYSPTDIEVVAAYDVDSRKVGKSIGEAIFSAPNCARIFSLVQPGVTVKKIPVLDGVSGYMGAQPPDRGFVVDHSEPSISLLEDLQGTKPDLLINYLPVGSEIASEYVANCCLDTHTPLLNCIPVFIASDKNWASRFKEAGIPIIGDDMKSLFGASILSQMLQELAFARGHKVKFHSQINVGGNTDFNNMMVQSRLESKKKSKENVIKAQNEIRGIDYDPDSIFAGPSTFIPYLKDNKICHIRMELEGFGGAPVELDVKLSVQDSENSAGVVIDAIRFLKVASELGLSGPLYGPSAFTQKTPPKQLTFQHAKFECDLLAERKISDLVREKNFD